MATASPSKPTTHNSQFVSLPPRSRDEEHRLHSMQRAWRAYRGDFTGRKPLKVDDGTNLDDNVLVNRCAPIVDKGVSFLFGPTVKVEVVAPSVKLVRQAPNVAGDPQDNPKTSGRIQQAQAYLEACWSAEEVSDFHDEDEDERMTTLTELAMNGAVCGQSFAKIVTQADTGGQTPSVVVVDPTTVTVKSDPDDVNCALEYRVQFDTTDEHGQPIEKAIVYARTDRRAKAWTITTYCRPRGEIGPDGNVIVTVQQGESQWEVDSETLWPNAWCPIHDCMNLPNPNEYWGIPDLTPDLIHLNDALNYVLSNCNKLLRMHAHPWPFISGASQQELPPTQPGKVLMLPAHDQELRALEAHGDAAALMQFASDLRSDGDEQSRVPGVALGRLESLPKGNISGVALQLLFQPLIEKTTLKRRLYGSLVRKLCQHLLELGGYGDLQVDIHWPNLLPVDDLAAAQTAQILAAIGVSEETLMQQLGYDPDAEAQKNAKKAQQQVEQFAKGQGLPPHLPGGPGVPGQGPSQPSAPGPSGPAPSDGGPGPAGSGGAQPAGGAPQSGQGQ